MPDPSDDLFRDDDEEVGGSDGAAPKGDPSTPPADPKSSDKRIRDLQSKADQETARANKAEARLKAILAASEDKSARGSEPPAAPDVSTALTEMARMFAVQQNPKLAEYGLTADDLTGLTPAEIAKSAADLVARFEKVETQVKNKVLAENGLAPAIEGDKAPTKSRDFSAMSSEDFKKVMEAAMRG